MHMETIQTVRKTDLARRTRKVIRDAQKGVTIVVENHGEPEVAIVDILDYRILRALIRFYVEPTALETGALLAMDVNGELERNEKVEVVMTHYLAGAIELDRAAELLQTPALDLRTRFLRLDVPLRRETAATEEGGNDERSAAWFAEG
jgi:antitoxin (DNA-binding transcriptional repressor) of toxin-antitoxin stability system